MLVRGGPHARSCPPCQRMVHTSWQAEKAAMEARRIAAHSVEYRANRPRFSKRSAKPDSGDKTRLLRAGDEGGECWGGSVSPSRV